MPQYYIELENSRKVPSHLQGISRKSGKHRCVSKNTITPSRLPIREGRYSKTAKVNEKGQTKRPFGWVKRCFGLWKQNPINYIKKLFK